MCSSVKELKMALVWFASVAVVVALLLPAIESVEQRTSAPGQKNSTLSSNSTNSKPTVRNTRSVGLQVAAPTKITMGDSVGLETAIDSHRDLTPAAGEHKKYILVKKKPKHKKIKMEVYKPKMKYKKIKMKVPVKKLKKKKVKGYLVKKEKHHY